MPEAPDPTGAPQGPTTGAPDPERAERLCLFGGSFDPVHRGHLALARAALEERALDRVLFLPAARPPHKPGRALAPGRDRVAMLELALADEPRCAVDPRELDRPGPSYTFDTVQELAAPGRRLFLLIGTDNLPGLPGWYRAEELLERVEVLVGLRDAEDLERFETLVPGLPPELVRRLRAGRLGLPPVPGRSTDLRAHLAAGAGPHPDLPPAVAEYVRRRGLYRGEGTP